MYVEGDYLHAAEAGLRLKEEASEQFPPVRGFSLPRSPARIVNQKAGLILRRKKGSTGIYRLRK
jgi:hypothetical protein